MTRLPNSFQEVADIFIPTFGSSPVAPTTGKTTLILRVSFHGVQRIPREKAMVLLDYAKVLSGLGT